MRKLVVAEREKDLASERAARSEAEDASRSKDDFIALASHELRSPLNAILGWTRILRQGRPDEEVYQSAAERGEASAPNSCPIYSSAISRPTRPARGVEEDWGSD